ncbi:MAG TPA: sigma-70 family RNA polymerase sigma factor [Thermoanaerobaculia bacterium]|jgi:RNA polymerase sigma factor (sigma-70 family)|nr:sigma-70 family RNA polymerase sigma factor [Thermoanaerobaculia bacterium]
MTRLSSIAGVTELEQLVENLRPRLKRILRRYGVPPHDADDLLQEAFLAVLGKWESIDNKEAWLIGTLRHRCARYWRQRRSSVLEAVDSALLEALSQPQPAPQERAALVWDLESVFLTLSVRHRAVLWLRFGLGLSTEEVADRLGYCPASIRKLTLRSLARLRLAVAPPQPPPPATPG